MSYNILVVGDEKELADVMELYLTADGRMVHNVTRAKKLWSVSHIQTWIWQFWM